MYKLPSLVEEICNNTIAITGVARSGTTIVGKLFHSLKNVEYIFEPPMLVPIHLTTINQDSEFKLLYESYVYDLLIGNISGRYINTNLVDDSSIYKVKDNKIIDSRLSITKSLSHINSIINQYILCFKIPSSTIILNRLKRLYPNMQIIFVSRNSEDVINSILNKKWLKKKEASDSILWPWKKISGVTVPWWVPDNLSLEFYDADELKRCKMYYDIILANKTDAYKIIEYEKLEDKKYVYKTLTHIMPKNKITKKTDEIYNSIKIKQ